MRDPPRRPTRLMKAAPELDRNLVERSARYLATRYADDPATWGHQDRRVWTAFVAFLRTPASSTTPIDVDAARTPTGSCPATDGSDGSDDRRRAASAVVQVRHRFTGRAARRRAGRRRPRRGRRRVRQPRRAERLRQEHAAAHPRRPARADRGHRHGRRPIDVIGSPGLAGVHAAEGQPAAVAAGAGQRHAGRRDRRGRAAPRRRPGPLTAARAVRARRLRDGMAVAAVGRHAPTPGVAAHVPGRPRRCSCSTSRSARSTPSPGADMYALAAGRVAGRPPHRPVRHPRRRRGAVPVRPGGRPVAPAGPGGGDDRRWTHHVPGHRRSSPIRRSSPAKPTCSPRSTT